MSLLSTELRSALRRLRVQPMTTFLVVGSLTLGIGLNAATFGLWNAVFYKGLPGLDSADLLAVYQTESGRPVGSISFPDYLALREGNPAFGPIAAFRANPSRVSMVLEDKPEVVASRMVTANFFSVLRLRPVAGRFFGPQESLEAHGDGRTAIVSAGFLNRRGEAPATVLGRDIRLNGQTFTIVGVASEEFRSASFGEKVDVWIPLAAHQVMGAGNLLGRRDPCFSAIGRLDAGVAPGEAQAAVDAIAIRIEDEHPETNRGKGFLLSPPGMAPFADSQAALLVGLPMATTALVLLMACVNLAGLYSAGSVRRRGEMALRTALGATRWRLIGMLLLEGTCMAIPAGLPAFLTSFWTTPLFPRFAPPSSTPPAVDLSPDWRVLVFSLLASLVCTVLFVVVPALRYSRPELSQALANAVRGQQVGRRNGLSLLAGLQAAASLPLLVVAALLYLSLAQARNADPGYSPQGLSFATLNLSLEGHSPDEGRAFYSRLCDLLENRGTGAAAAAARWLPRQDGRWGGRILPPADAADARGIFSLYNTVSPSFFETLSIPLLSGRYLAASDSPDMPRVAVVNASAARLLWGQDDPLGKTFRFSYTAQPGRPTRVVGVVGDTINEQSLRRPEVYFPLAQVYEQPARVLFKSDLPPRNAQETLRAAVSELDPNLPFIRMGTLQEHLDQTLWQQRLTGITVSLLGLLGLALTVLGVYGLSSLAVAGRLSEFGLRLTLGASRQDLWKLILKRNAAIGLLGIAVGLLLAVAAALVVSSRFAGLDPYRPAVFAAASVVTFLSILAAGVQPSRRAVRVDPARLLRRG